MKTPKLYQSAIALIFSLFTLLPTANATIIDMTLGNGGHGLFDSDIASFASDIFPIQSGQSFPFDRAIGHELITDPGNINWLFNYGAVTETILSATFSFGIWDHDSSSAGSQLDAFALEGIDLTSDLNTLFEAGGGALDNQFKIYTFTLGASFFANIADGLFSVDLDVGGSGLLTNGLTQVVTPSNFNGYHLIYSNLTIETQAIGNPDPKPVPEPSTLAIFALGMIGFASRRFKKQS
jgi:hypothetical protein